MRIYMLLLWIFTAAFIMAQSPTKTNRISIGKNTVIYGDGKYEKLLNENLEYNELDGYSGDYDSVTFTPYPPFRIKVYFGKYNKNRESHIQDQNQNILIWLNFDSVKDNTDYLERWRSDFEMSVNKGSSPPYIRIRDYVTYMPEEYSKRYFNADTTLMYSFDMKGEKINNRYGHHKAILIYKKGKMLTLNCFLTEEGLNKFNDKYLKDIEKMFQFKIEEK